jgi:C4-dicarboxylate-specific signal transduction histidine kinase
VLYRKPRLLLRSELSAIPGYAIAVLSVAIAIVVADILTIFLHTEPIVSTMLCAVIFAAWFGFGPGLLAIVLSLLAIHYYLSPPINSFSLKHNLFTVEIAVLPRLVLFSITALFVNFVSLAQRSAQQEALQAEAKAARAREELAHVTRLTIIGEMGASIAHEVNQPLAGIVTNAEACLLWLDRKTPNLDKARHSVELIIKDGNRAGEVTRSIRALSNKAASQRVLLDMNDVINDVIALVRHELMSHRVSLRTELAPVLPVVLADPVQMQQVIINLVINSIEAMEAVTDRPRELVMRSCQDKAGKVSITVKDSGVGIAAENADGLFGAFVTSKSNGMGMGLSICRSIIQAHSGSIWIEPNLTEGAAFHFTVPLHQVDAS